jgi:hypothetical protein
MIEITKEEKDISVQCFTGSIEGGGVYRNYFATGPNHSVTPEIESLVKKGLFRKYSYKPKNTPGVTEIYGGTLKALKVLGLDANLPSYRGEYIE